MSTTTTITAMQEDKRGDSSRKQLRLPAIAPKDDQASSTSSGRSGRLNPPAIPPRARLPPRSRTGCWTCRTRKVKCDEGRPVCGQCARLGHTCDYSPRLSFRDDTTRVVERMQDVTVAGSTIWDRPSLINPNRRRVDRSVGMASPSTSSADSTVDDLPPFASLLTDEDRERKAEASSPGTYNVVVNPESFQHLPEYSDDAEIKREAMSPIRRGSIATSLTGSFGRDSVVEGIPIPGDPNIVVLPRFEDLSRRPTRELRPPISPIVTSKPQIKREDSDIRLPPSTPENHILQHFRDSVWKYFVPPEHGPDSSMIVLDETASQFPALMQAIMAVACLALGQHDANDKLDALQHYSQVLPELQKSLKSEEDLASDGAFLTHFLMLIYEIAAADIEHPNIWPHHIQTLLKITLLRRRIFGAERFPFIVWWVCNIDLDAVLSGMGQGDFVRHMWKNDLIPPPSFHLYPLGSDGSSVVYTEEKSTLPTVLQLDYESTLLTIQLALLAHEFRQDTNFESTDMRQKAMNIKLRQTRIFDIQENLRRLWMVSPVGELSQARLPVRSQRLYQRAVLLYRACIIYSHTSMWPAQRLETSPNFDDEIATSVNEILHIAHNTIDSNCYSSKFMVFPLFMAGFASTDGNQKMLALDLIQKMEEEGLWRNTLATRRALEAVYECQNERFLNRGHSLDVDWLGIMIEQGLTVVNFGL